MGTQLSVSATPDTFQLLKNLKSSTVTPLILIKCEKAKCVYHSVNNSSHVAQTSAFSAPDIFSDSPSAETRGFYGYKNSNVHQFQMLFQNIFLTGFCSVIMF